MASVSDSLKQLYRSDIVSSLTSQSTNPATFGKSGSAGLVVNNNGTIEQSERLLTARPRYAPRVGTAAEIYSKGHATRGAHAYIRLLTTSDKASAYSSQSGLKSNGVSQYAGLTGPGSLVAGMVSDQTNSGYDQFLLTRVSCQLQEKLQVTETFGDGEVAYYFGRQPMMFNISGVLIDSPDNSWFTDWLKMYSNVLRGSELARNYELLRLVLPNMALTGTISATSWDQDSASDVAIGFSFQFLAKRIEPIPSAMTQEVPDSALADLINFSSASKFVSQQAINSLKTQAASLASVVSNPGSTFGDIGKALSEIGTGVGGTLAGWNNDLKTWVDSVSGKGSTLGQAASLFSTISANLNGIRARLVSPIYGILTSLTRLVRNTFGNVNSIFNSLFNPVRNVIRDITNIANQAVGLVNLLNSSIRGVGRNLNWQVGSTAKEFNAAMKAVGKAKGAIATAPATALQSIQKLFSSGAISSGAAFLQDNRKASLSSAVLSKGSSPGSSYKIAILHSASPYTALDAARI